jgi:hypothetical protein
VLEEVEPAFALTRREPTASLKRWPECPDGIADLACTPAVWNLVADERQVPRELPLGGLVLPMELVHRNARTYNLDPSADAGLADFQALILDQDRPIAESQRPEELPVDLSQELHIAGPDWASIACRRRLAELAAR